MPRLTSIFLIALFLNTWAGDELSQPRSVRAARSAGSLVSASQGPLGTTEAARGAWLARQVEDRETGRDARIAMRMRLFDRQGRVRERALSVSTLKGGPGRPVSGDRSLVRFTYPNDIKGTAFLVWEQPNADDERFLYLPSLGRVRRIAGSEAQESFAGSDLTYEDIGGREFENYTSRLIEAPSPGAWTAPDGSKHPVYLLESRSRDTGARFPRVRSFVRQDNFVVVRAEIFNKRDELQKTFEAVRLEKVSGYWTIMEMRVADSLERTRTELVLEKVEYNVGLKPDDFSRRELERGSGLRLALRPSRAASRDGGRP